MKSIIAGYLLFGLNVLNLHPSVAHGLETYGLETYGFAPYGLADNQSSRPDFYPIGSTETLTRSWSQRGLQGDPTVGVLLFPLITVPGSDPFGVTADFENLRLTRSTKIRVAAILQSGEQLVGVGREVRFQLGSGGSAVLPRVWVDSVEVQVPHAGSVIIRPDSSDLEPVEIHWDETSAKPVHLTFRGEFVLESIPRVFAEPGNTSLCDPKTGPHIKRNVWTLVNRVGLETYLKAVVPSEVYTTWPGEALSAQAVAARTYTLRKMQIAIEEANPKWDLDATTCFQSYRGAKNEKASTDAAVENTRGLALTYQGTWIEALYSAHSGGHTCSGMDCFGLLAPYLVAKPDALESLDPSIVGSVGLSAGKWTQVVSGSRLEDYFKTKNVSFVNGLSRLVVTKINSSQRVVQMAVADEKGIKILGADEDAQKNWVRILRKELGLRTSFFSIEVGPKGEHSFRGFGLGHGSGMNQWGTMALATVGKSFRQILEFYYPGTLLESVLNPGQGEKNEESN